MKREIRDKWVKALRSGRYKQGQGVLRSAENKFCCLGVLYDVCDGDKWEEDQDGSDAFCTNSGDYEMLEDGYQGLARTGGYPMAILAEMNDGGTSFNVLADHIEQSVPVED